MCAHYFSLEYLLEMRFWSRWHIRLKVLQRWNRLAPMALLLLKDQVRLLRHRFRGGRKDWGILSCWKSPQIVKRGQVPEVHFLFHLFYNLSFPKHQAIQHLNNCHPNYQERTTMQQTLRNHFLLAKLFCSHESPKKKAHRVSNEANRWHPLLGGPG